MKTRIIHTRFWQDSYIVELPIHEKLLFIYLLTNDRVSISGIYELPDRYIQADLGLTSKQLSEAKKKFQQNNKIIFVDGWIKIVNSNKYNSFNGEKLDKARERELALVPKKLLDQEYPIDTSIDTSIDTLSINNDIHINNNSNEKNKKLLEKIIEIVNPKEKVIEHRITKLKKLLKDYSEDEILKAAIAFSKSDWHIKNKQMSVDNLLAPSKFGKWYVKEDQSTIESAEEYPEADRLIQLYEEQEKLKKLGGENGQTI